MSREKNPATPRANTAFPSSPLPPSRRAIFAKRAFLFPRPSVGRVAMGVGSSTPDGAGEKDAEGDPQGREAQSSDGSASAGSSTPRSPGALGTSTALALRDGNEDDQMLPVTKVDTMQIMWQRALQAKTAALDRLRNELEEKDVRLRQMELERSVLDEANEYAEATVAASEDVVKTQQLAVQSTELVLHDMKSEMEERETRLDELSTALRKSSERNLEHELAVRAAHHELEERSAYFEAAESFLRQQLAQSSTTIGMLQEELGAGEEAMFQLQAQFEVGRGFIHRDDPAPSGCNMKAPCEGFISYPTSSTLQPIKPIK